MYATGSVKVISGSALVRGYGTAFTTYISTGNLFRLEDDATFYEVAAISNASNLTLSTRYTNTNYQTSRPSESIASANTATRVYSGTLDYTPVIQSSVVINASIESFTDDGAGVLTGGGTPAGSGTIAYDDGSWAIILGTDLTATINVTASYFSGDTLNGMTYQIVTDYTSNYDLPEMAESDIGFPKIFTKAVRLIDAAIYNASTNTVKVSNYLRMGKNQYMMFGTGNLQASVVAVATNINASCRGSLYVSKKGNLWILNSDTTATKV